MARQPCHAFNEYVDKREQMVLLILCALWPKLYANWLRVKLTAKAQVSGTESKAETLFGLSASATDMANDKVSPPGGTTSVFGSANVCSDPN